MIAIPANPDRWAPPFVITTRTMAGTGPQELEAMLPGDYFVAALPRDDVSALMNDSSWLAAVAAVATKITLAAGDTPVLRLRVTRLPDK